MDRGDILNLPVVPLRQAVLFPGPPVTLNVGRAEFLRSIEAAAKADGRAFVVAQRSEVEQPTPDDLFSMGVVAAIGHVQRGLAGVQVTVTPLERAAVLEYRFEDGLLRARVRLVVSLPAVAPEDASFVALHREVRERALEFGKLRGLPEEILGQVMQSVMDPGAFADLVAAYLELPPTEKQVLLETLSTPDRLRRVLVHLQRQIQLAQAQQQIRSQVQEEIGGRQRELYLREQMRAIQKELGEGGPSREIEELRQKISALNLPPDVNTEAERELARLERMGMESMEAQVIRTYLQWIIELPWNEVSDDHLDLDHAGRILDEDHYGLRDVKDRILEFLSVRRLRAAFDEEPDTVPMPSRVEEHRDRERMPASDPARVAKARAMARGPILLFAGPPGVGKTSVAQSIAKALGRRYVRVSLGGARDEADIRGHRRTYVGAMPGRIIQGMRQAGTRNPVFLLDEIDKLGVSFQGDPASALLEVLDPAQNDTFTDHYLNVPFDLSEVLFIATANVTHTIPPALFDRMETVEFAGYTEREKAEIAKRYLVPRQLEEAALTGRIVFNDEAIASIVTLYTRESGVRQLERQIGAVTRKLARRFAVGKPIPPVVSADTVKELLGRPRVHPEHAGEQDEVGVATGMFYSPAGGDIMFVEAAIRRLHRSPLERSDEVLGYGDVSLILTGQLGDVMRESARAALTYAATHADHLHIPEERLGSIEVHIHVPAGAIPKDGPSAGVTIATALASAMSGRAVRKDVAMSGEITLRGHVLPIGGVKEKVLGAHRAGIRHIVLPAENEPDSEEVPAEVRSELTFHWASTLDDVLDVALLPEPGYAHISDPDEYMEPRHH
jgi:ATP-dependent Lon protease